jgi:ribosomal protein L9
LDLDLDCNGADGLIKRLIDIFFKKLTLEYTKDTNNVFAMFGKQISNDVDDAFDDTQHNITKYKVKLVHHGTGEYRCDSFLDQGQ